MPRVLVLGLPGSGPVGLSAGARARLDQATFLAGGLRHLSFCNAVACEKLVLKNNFKELAERLEQELAKPDGRPVVLASGDPLFHGIGSWLVEHLGAERVEVAPAVSSMQVAFARAGLAWEDAALVSAHGHSLDALASLPKACMKVGVFTDRNNTPARVAEALLAAGWPGNAEAWVMEDLESDKERCTRTTLDEVGQGAWSQLNVVLAQRPDAKEEAR